MDVHLLFESQFDDPEADRSRIQSYLLEFIRTGIAPPKPELSSGRFRLDRRREPLGQCSWKWSEVTGKYIGCPFWSVEATRNFGEFAALQPAMRLARVAEKASQIVRRAHRLQHEHVFPRRDWATMMSRFVGKGTTITDAALRNLLEQYCIGCVVTAEEHSQLARRGDPTNPWRRYQRAGVLLVDNPDWPHQHRQWIEELGIVAAAR